MPDYYAEHKKKKIEKLLIELIAASVYIIKTTTVPSGDIHAHPRAVIPSFGSK